VTPSPSPVAPQPKPASSNSTTNNTSTNVVDSAAQAVNRVNWTRPSTPVFFNPSYLATPSTNAKFNTSLTKLYVAAERRWSVQVTTNDGTWVVIGNNVRFTPADGFLGKAVVKFQLVDTAGKLAHATLTAVVTGNPPILPATGNNANVLTVWAMFMLIFGMALLALRRSVRLKNR
jgi:LPXTG-motif cell wall-anchored protein